jgi:hypothetical protein
VLPALTRHGPVTAWIIDDTSFRTVRLNRTVY